MALTLKSNGTGTSNLIQAQWFNDFYNLFTGSMYDQPITFRPNVSLKAVQSALAGALTAAVTSGTGMSAGTYKYVSTFVTADGGETLPSALATVTTTTGNTIVNLSVIPTDSNNAATSRRIYRTKVGASTYFLLTTINDNTTTTYVDSTPDASLGTAQPPLHPTYGGSLFVRDSTGALKLTIANDGELIGATNVRLTTVGATSDIAVFTPTQATFSGSVMSSGQIGVTTPGDILDGSGFDTFISNRGGLGNLIHLRGGSTDLLTVGSNELFLYTQSIRTNGAFIGFKKQSGAKLAEMTSGGNFIAAGGMYTAGSTYTTGASATFDTFDFSETFQVDQEYPTGTILCPADVTTIIVPDGTPQLGLPLLSKCTHDKCNMALIVVAVPGFCAGTPNVPSDTENYDASKPLKQPCAMIGRVFATTTSVIPPRAYVCSDGIGGVRAMVAGDTGMSLGIALSPTTSGMCPVLIRPSFVSL